MVLCFLFYSRSSEAQGDQANLPEVTGLLAVEDRGLAQDRLACKPLLSHFTEQRARGVYVGFYHRRAPDFPVCSTLSSLS